LFTQEQVDYARDVLYEFPHNQLMPITSRHVYLTKSLPRFYSARPSVLDFSLFFLTRQATIELSRAPVKGEMYNKNYPHTYLRVHERREAEDRSV